MRQPGHVFRGVAAGQQRRRQRHRSGRPAVVRVQPGGQGRIPADAAAAAALPSPGRGRGGRTAPAAALPSAAILTKRRDVYIENETEPKITVQMMISIGEIRNERLGLRSEQRRNIS